jgi:hypothetical protein
MSMTHLGRCALVLLMVAPGLAGCGGSKQVVPSAPSSVTAPRPPATGFAVNSIFPTTAPSHPGEYEFRYLVDDHIDVARSDVVTVRQP